MNYIRHLHAFYQSIKKDDSLSALHVTLYLALFQYWNYNRFGNPFPVDRGGLMLLSKIKTKNSYHKCLKELHQKRFIIYHPSNSKFIKAKVSMIKLGLKMPGQNLDQFSLFDQQENPIFPTVQENQNEKKKVGANGIKNNTGMVSKTGSAQYQKNSGYSLKKDTVETTIVNASVSKTVPLRYRNQYRFGIKIDTGTVSKSILLIKHKHKTVNSSSVCYKKNVSEIFEKNKKIQDAISSFKNDFLKEKIETAANKQILPASKPTNINDSCFEKNQFQPSAESQPSRLSLLPPGKPTNIKENHFEKTKPGLKEVETFFLEKSFPVEEAQKFFYYNQSRNWMMNPNIPIHDWHAIAHKWMLIQKEKNISNSKQTNNGKSESKQSANASFLQDAKNDFFASSTRGEINHA